MATILDKNTVLETAPTTLSVHLDTTLGLSAQEARRRVNREVVTELGTGLIGREPELVIGANQVIWRVPIELSLPGLGNLGPVGTIEVDARTGEILTGPDAQETIIKHADLLCHGATTLPAK